jgi:hypothetical protein
MAGAREDSVRFEDLEFASGCAGGLRYVPNFCPNQAIHFGSLEFVAE